MSGRKDSTEILRIVARHPPDREERRLYALVGENIENPEAVGRQWAVIEGQYHFVIAERQRFLILHGAETGMFPRVHDQGPRSSEGIGIARTIAG
jgi:hypothetical protein